MGMYTGLRAKIKIKNGFKDVITMLHDYADWEFVSHNTVYHFIAEWAKFDRCNFIPFGVLSYMPDDFDDRLENPGEYGGGSEWDGEIWEFACSLKNYNGEIQFFVQNVLFPMCDEVYYCQSLYEEYQYPLEQTSFGYVDVEGEEYWAQHAINWKESWLQHSK